MSPSQGANQSSIFTFVVRWCKLFYPVNACNLFLHHRGGNKNNVSFLLMSRCVPRKITHPESKKKIHYATTFSVHKLTAKIYLAYNMHCSNLGRGGLCSRRDCTTRLEIFGSLGRGSWPKGNRTQTMLKVMHLCCCRDEVRKQNLLTCPSVLSRCHATIHTTERTRKDRASPPGFCMSK